jgi:hypothetical protein
VCWDAVATPGPPVAGKSGGARLDGFRVRLHGPGSSGEQPDACEVWQPGGGQRAGADDRDIYRHHGRHAGYDAAGADHRCARSRLHAGYGQHLHGFGLDWNLHGQRGVHAESAGAAAGCGGADQRRRDRGGGAAEGHGQDAAVVFPGHTSTTVLGSGFSFLGGVAVDGAGNVYVADFGHDEVKEIVAVGGSIPTSNPTILPLGSGFSTSNGVAVDGAGNVYVADEGNSLAKEIPLATPPSLSFGSTRVCRPSSVTGRRGCGRQFRRRLQKRDLHRRSRYSGDRVRSSELHLRRCSVHGQRNLELDGGVHVLCGLRTNDLWIDGDTDGRRHGSAQRHAGGQRKLHGCMVTTSFTVAIAGFTLGTGSGSSSASTIPGGAASFSLMLSPGAGATILPDAINFSVSGLPPEATATFSPATIAAGSPATTVMLSIQTSSSQALLRNENPFSGKPIAPVTMGFLLLPLLGLKGLRKRFRQISHFSVLAVAIVSLGALLMGLSGCAGSASKPASSQPSANYTVVVTATDATTGVQHTTNSTLTVQ